MLPETAAGSGLLIDIKPAAARMDTKKLVFIDVDGTLTFPGTNTLPESAADAVRKAQEQGHVLFLCSGRNHAMLKPLLKHPFAGAVASAGGYIFAGDRVIFDCPMEQRDFETAMRLFHDNGVFRTIEAKDAAWCDEGMGAFLAEASGGNSEQIRWREAIEKELGIEPIRKYDGSPVYKIIFMCKNAGQIEPAQTELGGKYNFLIWDGSENGILNGELVNRRFDKGKGVRIASEALGFGLADTIRIGDSLNDLEMIETVGTSVCMENGSQVLKERSSIVCPAVDRDGLAWTFRKLGLI